MDFSIEDEKIKQELQKLLLLLNQDETIQQFKKIENKVKINANLAELVEDIKKAQKDAVQFAHYGKPEAEKEALKKADELTQEFNEHPLVVAYREQLIEANDLVQYVTETIQQRMNEELGKEGI